MFKKTIAVLLMLSIVLSSCGKKDKDKSDDFVRTTLLPTGFPISFFDVEDDGGVAFEAYTLHLAPPPIPSSFLIENKATPPFEHLFKPPVKPSDPSAGAALLISFAVFLVTIGLLSCYHH